MRPFRFAVQVAEPTNRDGWRSVAKQAEDLGYATLSMSDHFDNALSPFPALAVAAEATTTLRLATWVLGNDFRHPAVVARDAATLDALSGGRFELGIGAGWMTTDYTTTGLTLDSPGTRIDRLRESATIIRALLAGETVNFSGEFYSVTDLVSPLSPTQSPNTPLVMGGGGKKMLRLAGELCDVVGVNPNLASGAIDAQAAADGTAERTDNKIAWIREGAGARFDDIELQTRVHLAAITDDPDKTAADLSSAIGLSPEAILASPHMLVGTVSSIVEKIQAVRERYGITYFTWGGDTMEAMAPVVAELV